jgi:hypothetical protein
MAIAVGVTVFQVTAILDGFSGRKSAFVKTAKFRIVGADDRWRDKVYSPRQIAATTYVEGALVLLFLTAIVMGITLHNIAILPFHFLLACGYAYVFGRSIIRA